MFAIGKDLGLVGQVRAARVDQIDAGKIVFPRDLLGAQMLLHRDGIVRAALDRRVVAHDHAFAARNTADAGDDARRVNVALVHPVGGERRKLQERRPRVDQPLDPVAGQQLAALRMALARTFVAPKRGNGLACPQLGDEPLHARGVRLERRVVRRHGRLQNAHRSSTATAVASPPPMHSAATPRVLPRFRNALISVTMIRAPEAPMG